MPIFNSLRNRLASVFTISLSSPFFEGRDTGVQSWRHSILDRLPRMGTPDIWASEEEYFKHIRCSPQSLEATTWHGKTCACIIAITLLNKDLRRDAIVRTYLADYRFIAMQVATLVRAGCLPRPQSRCLLGRE